MSKRSYFSKDRGAKEHISIKLESKICIFLLEGQNRNVLKHKEGNCI